jgi:hypothetical protein
MKPKFDFYEVVTINTTNPKKSYLNGQRGAVLGKAENADGGHGYDIWIYKFNEVFSLDEEELLATGEFDKRESFYSGESIRVSVDPKTGEGKIEF